jgi:RNA polymerase sigma-70 factor (ECF subfamily)
MSLEIDGMERWQTDDATAFEALFRQYEGLVFRNAYFITGSRLEAEEITQDVFVSVWKARRTFNPDKGKVTTWLHRITVNKCLERQRKKKPIVIPIENIELPGGEGSEDVVMNREEREQILSAMSSLDNKHRAVLVLRYFNELTYDEIALTMGIPAGTVKSRIYTAIQTLKKQLCVQKREAST